MRGADAFDGPERAVLHLEAAFVAQEHDAVAGCECSVAALHLNGDIVAQIAGISRVAKLAFLTYGPMMDMKLIFLYSSVFRKRFVLGMVFALAAAVGGLSLVWGAVGLPG